MATTTTQIESRALMEYLTKALGLPQHLTWMELRVAVNEVITVRCEWLPDVVDPESGAASGAG